jgi:protein TonB
MFEQTFVPTPNRTRSGASLAVSLLTQVAAIFVLLLIPLIYTDALPRQAISAIFMAPPPPPPPPPPTPVHETVVKRTPRPIDDGIFHAPAYIPDKVAILQEDPMPPSLGNEVQGSVPVPGAPVGGSLSGLVSVAVAPAAAPVIKDPPKVVRRDPVRVSGGVIQAMLIKRVVPPYPSLARQARVQGTVRFTAVIAKDGTIQNLQLISGHPLLVDAARNAIRQWVYKPTFLGGDPVEVITQIEFTFVLGQ